MPLAGYLMKSLFFCVLVFLIASRVSGQPAPMLALPDGTLFRPTAAQFIAANGIAGGGGGTWGSIVGTLSSQTDLNTALGLKAPLASPAFTGIPLAPTAAVDTNTTQLATTAFVIGQTYLRTSTAASTYQPLSANLTSFATVAPSANGRSLVSATDYAAMRALLDLEVGVDFLPYPTGTPTGLKFLRDDNSWQLIAGGGDALVANPLSQFAATTSAQLRGVLSDEVGTGVAYFIGGDLGTPSAVALTNATGLPTAGILNSAVTLAKMADMATASLLGRNTSGTGAPEVLSASTVRTLLSLVIGANVQAYDADLDTWAAKTPPSGTVLGTTDTQALTNKSISGATNTLTNIPNGALSNSTITIGSSAIALGGAVTGFDGISTVLSASGQNISFGLFGSLSVLSFNGTSGDITLLSTNGAINHSASSHNFTGAITGTSTIRPQAATSVTTAAAGVFAFDTNAWASGRGAMQLYDGTANTFLVGVLASDTPTNGQVPKWNTGGTVTWEDLGTTIGNAIIGLTNPSAVTFLRMNADNTATARSAADFRTDLSLVVGTNLQAYDADLTTYAGITPSANVQTLLGAASFSAFRSSLGLDSYEAHGTVGATETIDATTAWHSLTLDENLTITVSNWPASGTARTITLELLQDGTGTNTVTWPAGVLTAPTVTTTGNAVTLITLSTRDGGTTIYAVGTADGGGGGLASTDIDTSAELRDIVTDESGTGALIFAGGAIGAATATTPSAADNDTSVATTAFVQGEIDSQAAPIPTVNGQTGTTYTLVIGDANKVVTMTNGSANTLTIPPNASVAFATGTIVIVGQLGAGATSIDPDTGVTLNGGTSTIAMSGQRTWTSLLKTGTNAWETYGGDFVIANAAITGATKTKITYDAKGLVTAGADAAQADITGITTADSPQFAGVNVGHASDTTLTRSSAGVLAVEGVNVITTSGVGQKDVWLIPIGDETTAITTGTKVTFRAPFAATVTAVRVSLTTDSSSGTPTFDIHETGTTILSTKLTIDATEKTSTTAAAAAVISDSAIADDAELTIDVDVAGTGAAGGKVAIYVTRL
jgi:hypothetical protein